MTESFAGKSSLLKSMTGYAQARVEQDGWAVQLSVRSVNHRFLDLRVRIPEGWDALETEIRRVAREHVRRGHLDITLRVDAANSHSISINQEIAAEYLKAAKSLGEQFGVKSDPDLAAILRLPGVTSSGAPGEDEIERLAGLVRSCLTEAIGRLEQMKQVEGRTLREELSQRLGTVAGHARKIEELAARARPAYAKRLEARLNELLGNFALDPARLAQEAAFAAEHSDTTEESARLRSHVQQFRGLLDAGGEAGKKLDFLLQEMQRETNTLLSKTNGIDAGGLEITQLGLELKSEIEKLREQVQNIE
ncbi:MAG TPA: YicC/YloC family endoribonuclease [Candidatus Acidoferrales bacterium]|nr:YicC/YloC family endoribonuclease [Candidatus Acidoferrales bacterium]